MRNRAEATAKARELVEKMTLEEKASQLKYDAPAIPRLGIPAYNWGNEVRHGTSIRALQSGVRISISSVIQDGDADMKRTEKTRI